MFPSSYFAPTYFPYRYYPPVIDLIVNTIKQVFCITGEATSQAVETIQQALSLTVTEKTYLAISELANYSLQGIKADFTIQGIEQSVLILSNSISPLIDMVQSQYEILGSDQSINQIGSKADFNVNAEKPSRLIVNNFKIEC